MIRRYHWQLWLPCEHAARSRVERRNERNCFCAQTFPNSHPGSCSSHILWCVVSHFLSTCLAPGMAIWTRTNTPSSHSLHGDLVQNCSAAKLLEFPARWCWPAIRLRPLRGGRGPPLQWSGCQLWPWLPGGWSPCESLVILDDHHRHRWTVVASDGHPQVFIIAHKSHIWHGVYIICYLR